MKKVIEEWVDVSEYDLETAVAMFNTGRYLYVAFMCQQAIEKILKAIYVQTKNELPQRTHNLLYLVDILRLEIKDPDKELLSKLSHYYLETRYPGERDALAKEINKDKAEEFLTKTKGVWRCLRQMLQ